MDPNDLFEQNNISIQQSDPNDLLQQQGMSTQTNQQNTSPQSAFMDGVENFNRQFGRMSEGIMSGLASLLGMDEAANSVHQYSAQMDKSAAEAAERSPLTSLTGNVLGGIGSTLAYGGGYAGVGKTYAQKMATSAGVMGAQLFAEEAPTLEERMNKGAAGAVVGGLAVPLIDLGKIAWNGIFSGSGSAIKKMLDPKKAALSDVGQIIESDVLGNSAKITDSVAAANKLGVKITPAQALSSTALNSVERNLGDDLSTKVIGNKFIKEQEQQVKSIFDNTLKGIISPEDKQKVAKVYEAFKGTQVSADVLNTVESTPSLKTRLTKMNTETDSLMKNLPDNSLYKMNALKNSLDDELRWDTFLAGGKDKLQGYQRDAIMSARDKLLLNLDQTPGYANARAMAQKQIIQDSYNKLLDQKGALKGNNKSIDDVYNALFNTPEKQKFFLEDIATVGGDVDTAKNLITVIGQIRKDAIEQSVGHAEKSISNPTLTSQGLMSKFLNDGPLAKYKEELVKLITDGNQWAPQVAELIAEKNTVSKASGFVSLLKSIKSAAPTVAETAVRSTAKGLISGVLGSKQSSENSPS